MDIGEKLVFYRKKAGHKQESLSRASGVGRRTISAIEKNIGSPKVDTLERLLAACKVTLGEFFTETHPQPADPPAQDALDKLDMMLHDPDSRDFAITLMGRVFRGSEK